MDHQTLFRTQGFGIVLLVSVLDGLYVSTDLIFFFRPLRYGLLILLSLYFLHQITVGIKTNLARITPLIGGMIHILFFSYALTFSGVYGGATLIESRNFLLIFLGVFTTIFCFEELNKKKLSSDKLHKNSNFKNRILSLIDVNFLLPIFFIMSPFALWVTNTLVFTPVPQIQLTDLETVRNYSQGTSGYFSVSSIAFTFLATTYKENTKYFGFIVVAFVMLGLSALGGARGDFLIGVLVCLFIIVRRSPWKKVIYQLGFFLIVMYIIQQYINFSIDDLLIVQRLSQLGDGNFGHRDTLLLQSIDLLSNATECTAVGCGFNYFQIYYGYEYGWYPHNIFAELLITYGPILGIFITTLSILGIFYGFVSWHQNTFVYWALLYFLGVGLKSGSLLGLMSMTTVVIFSYLGLTLLALTTRRFIHEPDN